MVQSEYPWLRYKTIHTFLHFFTIIPAQQSIRSRLQTQQANMHIRSLILPLLFGPLSHATALPAAGSAADCIEHADNEAGLVGRDSTGKLTRQSPDESIEAADGAEYWLESISHQGVSPLGPSGYTVFRNVKDFGAKGELANLCVTLAYTSLLFLLYSHLRPGDGVTDDTDAINEAMSSGDRCGEGCFSSTTTPALVYFPSGTYVISSPIFDYYNTIIAGNPNSLPVLKASSSFDGGYLIDGDPYFGEFLNWPATTVFWRQVRNLVLDTTDVAANREISGIHWPTAQATSLQNMVFELSADEGTQHQGIFCESGEWPPPPSTPSLGRDYPSRTC